jgi:hypothetical protein
VNEKRVSGEDNKVEHRRENYPQFLNAPPGTPLLALRANGYQHYLVDEIQRTWPQDHAAPCSNGLGPPGRSACRRNRPPGQT